MRTPLGYDAHGGLEDVEVLACVAADDKQVGARGGGLGDGAGDNLLRGEVSTAARTDCDVLSGDLLGKLLGGFKAPKAGEKCAMLDGVDPGHDRRFDAVEPVGVRGDRQTQAVRFINQRRQLRGRELRIGHARATGVLRPPEDITVIRSAPEAAIDRVLRGDAGSPPSRFGLGR